MIEILECVENPNFVPIKVWLYHTTSSERTEAVKIFPQGTEAMSERETPCYTVKVAYRLKNYPTDIQISESEKYNKESAERLFERIKEKIERGKYNEQHDTVQKDS